ncbi:sulfite exporter TauE/SafE family protein [Trueperella abortisuis]|uniref:Probable membrane transporter protein n=1 Tax=Trueperella abortisuis TaxID=445930 RepID=A0ABT9PM37_9ACTO|nr:sulfite exporter TauE/SafE family protein [Trueperella abortisuis]MDP9833205.1 putative membrane protein YfcA [Trueperella abortisuis]
MARMILAAMIGLAVGVVVGMLGAGGGILSVPILVYILGQEPHQAAAASLVIVALTACVSIIPHARAGRVNWRDGLVFAALSALGSFVGARLSALVAPAFLMASFGVLLSVVAVVMLRNAWTMRGESAGGGSEDRAVSPLALAAVATLTGVLTGFFGVGGGFAVVPALVLVLHFSPKKATGTSLLVMIIASAVGLLGRIGTGVELNWGIALAFAAASMGGGLVGAKLTTRVRESTLTLSFGVLLACVAVGTLIEAVPGVVAG